MWQNADKFPQTIESTTSYWTILHDSTMNDIKDNQNWSLTSSTFFFFLKEQLFFSYFFSIYEKDKSGKWKYNGLIFFKKDTIHIHWNV